MSKPQRITIDDVEYVRADSVTKVPTGKREVLVIDRGWIFAGDVEVIGPTAAVSTHYRLHRPVNLRSYYKIGFEGVIADPQHKDVTIKRLDGVVDVPIASVLFRVPVSDDWGLSDD